VAMLKLTKCSDILSCIIISFMAHSQNVTPSTHAI